VYLFRALESFGAASAGLESARIKHGDVRTSQIDTSDAD
jgi:hypothetical protein